MNDNKTPYRKKYAVELKHYGVEGMKWGVRKDDDEARSVHRVTKNYAREIVEAGRRVAAARSDYESGGRRDRSIHDFLSRDALDKIDASLDVLTSKVERYEDSRRSPSLSGMNMDFNTYSDRRLQKLSSARDTCSRLMRAIGDVGVPSHELSDLCGSAESSFADLYREYEWM